MNNFTQNERQLDLVASMFQNLFPSLNITNVKF